MNRVLIVTEGPTDKKAIDAYFFALGQDDICVVPYGANIFMLYGEILESGWNYDDFDIVALLKQSKNGTNKELLEGDFTDIFIVFDEDIHAAKLPKKVLDSGKTKYQILREMAGYFCESTDNGKLIVDFPMYESLNDYRIEDGNLIINEPVSSGIGHGYKSLVNERGTCLDVKRIGLERFHDIARANFEIARNIVGGNAKDVFEIHVPTLIQEAEALANEKNMLFILNMLVFIPSFVLGKMVFANGEGGASLTVNVQTE